MKTSLHEGSRINYSVINAVGLYRRVIKLVGNYSGNSQRQYVYVCLRIVNVTQLIVTLRQSHDQKKRFCHVISSSTQRHD